VKIWWILQKEMIDGLRDRRAMLAALSFALLGPLLMVATVNGRAAMTRETPLVPFELCGAGSAPELVAHLQSIGLTVAEAADICVDIPGDYAERQAAGKTVHIRVLADLADADPTVDKIRGAITAFSHRLGAKRLMARGVSPQVATPIVVDMHSTNSISRVAAALSSVFILYLVFAPFIIVAAMAADTTAGERERHSLGPLLTHSVGTAQVVLGKFLALTVVNTAGTVLCVTLSLLLLERSAIGAIGLRIATDAATGLTVCLQLAPLCALVAAAQLAIGLFSRTAKEAQQTLMIVSLLPIMASMALLHRPGIGTGVWPVAWELKALADPLLGSSTPMAPFYLVAVLELGIAGLLLLAGMRQLSSERALT
jgi:sodium transport system permease protein